MPSKTGLLQSKNSSPLMKKKVLPTKDSKRENKTSLSKKLRGWVPNFETKKMNIKKLKISNWTKHKQEKAKKVKKSQGYLQQAKKRTNLSFLNQKCNLYESKRKQKPNLSTSLKKFQSRSLKKKYIRNTVIDTIVKEKLFDVYKYNKKSETENLKLKLDKETQKRSGKKESEERVSITHYQSLDSKSFNEANSHTGVPALSKTEKGSFYSPKPTVSGLVKPTKNIFYQNSISRENNQCNSSRKIQIINNQVNNYEITISQHFVNQNETGSLNPDKELIFSPETENQDKNVIFSNFNNISEESTHVKINPKKKPRVKNLSLNLKELYFDLPSMRNLKASESRPNLQNNSNPTKSKDSTISGDSRGKEYK